MTQIKDYVLLLVGSCLICGGLTILAPNGHFERLMRLIGSVFLLLCLLSPLKNTWDNFYSNRQNFIEAPSAYTDQQSWDYAANAMCETMQEEIDGYVGAVVGKRARKIDINIKAENQTFSVEQITITLDKEDMIKASAVADYVAIKIGVRPHVISNSSGE